ncbi:MAG: helix-turn-helix domain-containing protein, partial [Ruminococcaceae bacterium]|nr:helix-turn-helix domain-containing protein [Oscillospiraceae bacterium]
MRVLDFTTFYYYTKDHTYAFEGHRHGGRQDFEANIVLSGEMEITCGDQVFRLHEGELALWCAAQFHRNRVISDGTVFISLHFSSDEELAEPRLFRLNSHDLAIAGVLHDELGDHAAYITPASRNLLEALLMRISGRSCEPALIPVGPSAIYSQAAALMAELVGENPTAHDIARRCGVCLTTLKNAFAQCAGKGVKAYFMEMKLERARGLIADGTPIEETAAMLGFSSPAYFSQCFRRHHGMSAS